MILIKIDRKSIKKNPNAGNTVTRIRGHREATFTVTGELPDYLEEDKNMYVSSWTLTAGSNDIDIRNCALIDFDIFDKLSKEPNVTNLQMTQSGEAFHHAPEPKHHYKHKDTQVQCCDCKEKFKRSKLESQSYDSDYSNTVCPKCGEWDCVNLKYEKIEDAIS